MTCSPLGICAPVTQQLLENTVVQLCTAELGARTIMDVLPSGVCAPITQQLLENTAVLICTADLAPLRGLGVCALVAQ